MDFQVPAFNLIFISPLLIVIGWGMGLMIVDMFLPQGRKHLIGWLSLVGYVVALVQTLALWGWERGVFTPAGGTP